MRRPSTALGLALLTGAVTVMAAGCGDQTAANKRSIENALNHDYKINADCLFDRPMPFPYDIAVSDTLLAQTRNRLDAMVAAGLLDREEQARQNGIVNHYTLTALGSRAAGNGRFCYGHREITSVEKFSPPTDYQGKPLTTVEYHFVLKNSAEWVQDTEVRNAFPQVAKSFQPEPEDQATLIRADEGWMLTY
ncbi:MAG TPA: hypothetical protein VHX11_02765 [Acidobacteriaceae bacterium]|nr:hypothetical protein [Acidobacteriaceae bacterium]